MLRLVQIYQEILTEGPAQVTHFTPMKPTDSLDLKELTVGN